MIGIICNIFSIANELALPQLFHLLRSFTGRFLLEKSMVEVLYEMILSIVIFMIDNLNIIIQQLIVLFIRRKLL